MSAKNGSHRGATPTLELYSELHLGIQEAHMENKSREMNKI